eukprot:TRINITY_DN3993_c0_g1_i1.p1 TRINITY_DN3993_c0_g1~~TRINITY_DN3993_c0_g1_i1.p1  ORF type:complete len:243 (+),score=22.82 TRINITY_DN3993_c0_g1_i1:2-730(+)
MRSRLFRKGTHGTILFCTQNTTATLPTLSPMNSLQVITLLSYFTLCLGAATAGIKFGHAIPGHECVSVRIDNERALPSLCFEQFSGGYLPVLAETLDITVYTPFNKLLLNTTVSPKQGKWYTCMLNKVNGKVHADTYNDDAAIPAYGNFSLRFSNQSPDTNALDIYIDGDKVLSNVVLGRASSYLSLAAKPHFLEVKKSGQRAALLRRPLQEFPSGRMFSIYLEGDSNGGFYGIRAVATEDA